MEGVKLLGRACSIFAKEFPALGLPPPKLILSDSSAKAKAAIESVGGSVELRYMGRVPTRAFFNPEKFPILPASNGIPPKRKWDKYGFTFPADRLYHGTEKRKTFPVRTPPKE